MKRRDFLSFGTVQLGGLYLPTLLKETGGQTRRAPRAKACILIFLDGGASHIDLFDMKPDAQRSIRGPFQPISTTVPGLQICEHLPLTAKQMHHVALIRSMRHEETVHDPAVYQALTGYKHLSAGGGLKVDPTDHPQLGTVFGKLNREAAVMPKIIELPETMKMQARVLPGQNAGFLGQVHDPFRVTMTPDAKVIPPEVELPDGVTGARVSRRTSLLQQLNARLRQLESGEASRLDTFQQQALTMLQRPQVRSAFDIEHESASVRERYGLNRHGQSVLLARRLVEAGARFVTVYWGNEPQDWADGKGPRPANNPWDTHRNHFPLLKDSLVPRADRAFAALIEDLRQRGMLADTLVVWMGEFGRTPKISEFASRDHWPYSYAMMMAGAGLPAGATYGKTDATASEVTESPVSPADITATIFALMGVDPTALIYDRGRPFPISTGRPVAAFL